MINPNDAQMVNSNQDQENQQPHNYNASRYDGWCVIYDTPEICDKAMEKLLIHKTDKDGKPYIWATCLDENGNFPEILSKYYREGYICHDFVLCCKNKDKIARQIYITMPQFFRDRYYDVNEPDKSGYAIRFAWHGDFDKIDPDDLYDYERRFLREGTRSSKKSIEDLELWLPPKYETVNIIEITQANVKTEHVAKGLLGKGESLLIVGTAGIGKSLLVHYLAFFFYICTGKNLWDLFPVEQPQKSLILQAENGFAPTGDRLNLLINENTEFIESDGVFIHKPFAQSSCRVTGKITDPEFQKRIVDALQKREADILFMDPLISFHSAQENDNTAMRHALDCLQEKICEPAGVALIATHHFNKMGGARGASSIRDWAANVLLLELEKIENQSAIIKVIHDKARNYPQQDPFYLKRTPGLSFERIEKPGSKSDVQANAVVEVLQGLGGSVEKQTQLLEPLQIKLNCKITNAKKAISVACEQRKIIVIPSPKGNATGYRLL